MDYDREVCLEVVAASQTFPATDRPPGTQDILGLPLDVTEGKGAADAIDPKWATRNAKLRTSRKLLFAGGLVTVLLCHLMEAIEMPRFLARWFDVAPIDRLAAAFLYADVQEPGARAVAAYDRWIALIGSREARQQLMALSFETREQSELFTEIREIGTAFQAGLDALLFSSALAPVTRKYLIF